MAAFSLTFFVASKVAVAVHRDRPAPEGADPHRVLPGVPVEDPDVLDRDAEAVADDLRPGRLVALAGGPGADDHGDGRIGIHPDQTRAVEGCGEPVVGPGEPDLGEHRRTEAADLDIGADPDSDQPALGAGLLLAPAHPGVVADLDQLVHGGLVVAGIE